MEQTWKHRGTGAVLVLDVKVSLNPAYDDGVECSVEQDPPQELWELVTNIHEWEIVYED